MYIDNRTDEILNIKKTSEFIFLNSGIILDQLTNEKTKESMENYLQILLLCNFPFEENIEICQEISSVSKNNKHKNNYTSAINIIFIMVEYIMTSGYNDEGKERLRNKLRQHARHFECPNKLLKENKQFVKLK